MKKISYPVLIAFAAALSHADTLAWRVPDTEWGAWHNPANWAIEKPDGEPAGRIPGFDDRFFPEQTFRFDLGGKTGQIGRWSINSWIQRTLYLTNGTLEGAMGLFPYLINCASIGGETEQMKPEDAYKYFWQGEKTTENKNEDSAEKKAEESKKEDSVEKKAEESKEEDSVEKKAEESKEEKPEEEALKSDGVEK